MDRNEKASREIKASVASAHIFENENVNRDDDNSGDIRGQVSGDETNCPFRRLGLDVNIVRAITNPDGYFKLSQPTIVQTRAITALLPEKGSKMKGMSANDNLFIQSETGSGKTLAYLLPILQVRILFFLMRHLILRYCYSCALMICKSVTSPYSIWQLISKQRITNELIGKLAELVQSSSCLPVN